jgi:hypothetical protein
MANTPGNPTWRDMNRDSPDYFAAEARHEGYPESVAPPPYLRGPSGIPTREPGGFRAACTFAIRHPNVADLQLVHGTSRFGSASERSPHAWVELPGNLTFDGATQAFYQTDTFHTAGNTEVHAAYSSAEAARLLLDHGHPGPWPILLSPQHSPT